MVEVLIVMGIFIILTAMSVFFDMSFYRGTSFNSDYDMFVGVLQRTRSRAINNINESRHGLRIGTEKYILFRVDPSGTEYVNEEISRNPSTDFNGFSEVIFYRLSGSSNFSGNIILTDGAKTATVSINDEGQIDW